MLDWLRDMMAPPPRWSVAVDGEWIRIADDDGGTRAVAKAAVSEVAIETTDRGIEGIHHWWLLHADGERTACVYPLGADGEPVMAAWLRSLPGFDHGGMVKALTSTTSGLVTLWRRADGAVESGDAGL